MTAEIRIAILAKAPVAGFVKTRLIPVLDPDAAASLYQRLLEHAVATAIASEVGPIVLWCAPDIIHPSFTYLAAQFPITLRRQVASDLGARMLATLNGPTLVVGCDCPALTAACLRQAADALRGAADVVLIPAEDGGYVLIGAHDAKPALFSDIAWGTSAVLAETRARIARLGLRLHELAPLWDVDEPADLDRLQREYPALSV